MKKAVLLLFLPISVLAQYANSYLDGKPKIQFDTLHGTINGKFTFSYPSGKPKASGQIKDNQKVGLWKFYAQNGAVITTRKYEHNLNFSTGDVKPSSNSTKNFQRPKVNDNDLMYYNSLLTLVKDDSNANAVFFDNNLLLDEIRKYVNETPDFEVYENLQFNKKLTSAQITAILKDESIHIYLFREVVYFDSKSQTMNRRISAICPISQENNEIKPLLTVYADDFIKKSTNKKLLETLFFNRYYADLVEIEEARLSDKKLKSEFGEKLNDYASHYKKDISFYDIQKPFDLEAYFLENEVNNILRMSLEPELFVSTQDSVIIRAANKKPLKYKIIE
ncbi:MAG: hypothetical protein EOO50_15730 [Flavobacterium sp.]|uniref:hypothetical protein n=1 Tax=Flavobacterium sp. TaxID=239 RepID=UPI00120B872B|nr:hypothetical protein [Flavobacterium sp.]RZJ64406.1 MAG: hypothetical protein EOO50_15730 [Flavobacterium sp.]